METKAVSVKGEITFEDLMKADIRICQITSVSRVENTDKLYVLSINTGFDERVVVSAIADKVTPEQLLNKKMPFVLNLAPRKIRGIESFGMIIMAEGNNGEYYDLPSENAEVGAILI